MRRLITSFALVLLLTSACGQYINQSVAIAPVNPTLPPTSVGAVTDSASFAEALRASGSLIVPEGHVSLSFLQVQGQLLRVGDQPVQVYEYPDDAEARDDAARFSRDGAWVSSDIGPTLVNWFATPHLYRASRLIAVYIGDQSATLALLETLLGTPFAGGSNPYHTAVVPVQD